LTAIKEGGGAGVPIEVNKSIRQTWHQLSGRAFQRLEWRLKKGEKVLRDRFKLQKVDGTRGSQKTKRSEEKR